MEINPQNKRGSALILVLWIIGMLSMITLSFVFDAHLEGKIVSYSRKQLKCEVLASSGIELAKSYLNRSREVTGNESDDDIENDPQYREADELRQGRSVTISREMTTSDGEYAGTITVSIEPEESLRNLNKLTEEDWERIFELEGIPEDYWPDLIDSYFDWTDDDDEPRENGAETDDYYSTLTPPYSAANAPFQTVEELARVKGFTSAILNGGILNPEAPPESQIVISNGISRLFTTYGSGKVNINALGNDSLGQTILQTLPGVDDIGAGAIIEERENSSYTDSDEDERSFRSVDNARTRLNDYVEDNEFFNNISTGSEIFNITSVGQYDQVTKKVSAVVYVKGDIWRILEWREEP